MSDAKTTHWGTALGQLLVHEIHSQLANTVFDATVESAERIANDSFELLNLTHVISTASGSVYRIDEWDGVWFIYQENGDTLEHCDVSYHPQLLAIASDVESKKLKLKLGGEPGKVQVLRSNELERLTTVIGGRRTLEHPECSWCADGIGGPSHDGSPSCQSGSIASGGGRPHCSCDTCF